MDEKTRRTLNAINRRFYRDSADAFSRTRGDPWPGWRHIPRLLEKRAMGHELRTLDVGCGNGRFGAYLAAALPARRAALHYVAVDASEPLLAELRARRLPLAEVATRRLDLVEDPSDALPEGPFALIAVFGVLHHVPGRCQRRRLLRALADRLEPGGLLALAFWRFGAFDRFRGRQLAWSDFNRSAEEPVDEDALEDGDQLLAWGDGAAAFRYCHHAEDGEMQELIASLPLRRIADYTDDGRDRNLNRYFILEAGEGA